MKILVPVKRVVDYNIKIRIKADGSGVERARQEIGVAGAGAVRQSAHDRSRGHLITRALNSGHGSAGTFARLRMTIPPPSRRSPRSAMSLISTAGDA